MTRPKLIAGNWKMYTNAASARALAEAVVAGAAKAPGVGIAVCPPFPWLGIVAEVLRSSPVALGAQNCHFENEGAFTGETSPRMLREVGCTYVIIGHSERRHGLGESDALLGKKALAALAVGLKVIFCIGETLDEREANQTNDVLARQLVGGLAAMPRDQVGNLVIAYEPVWAIGTGKTATTEQAQEAHAFVREKVAELFGLDAAAKLLIQYGGSVKPENAAALLKQPDIDGALVGGASLKADSFLAIVRSALTDR